MKNEKLVTFKLLAQRFWASRISVCGTLWYMVLCDAWHFAFSVLGTLLLSAWRFASWCLVLLALCFSMLSALGILLLCVLHSWHSTSSMLGAWRSSNTLLLSAWCSWHFASLYLVLYFLGAWLCLEQVVSIFFFSVLHGFGCNKRNLKKQKT